MDPFISGEAQHGYIVLGFSGAAFHAPFPDQPVFTCPTPILRWVFLGPNP